MLRITYRCCPQCGLDNAKVKNINYATDGWNLKKCPSCNFVYLDAAPVYEELQDGDFAWEKTTAIRTDTRKKKYKLWHNFSKATRWRLSVIKKKNMYDLLSGYMDSGTVLDLGCGKGGSLLPLPETFKVIGIEISTYEAKHASEALAHRNGLVINKPSLFGLQTLNEDSISAVFLRSYLEHETHPREVLEEVYRALHPNGIAIIKVPNYGCINRIIMGSKWCGFRFPDHLNYFTPKTLTNMAINAGFEIARFGIMDKFPTSDNMWLIIKKPALT
jgi:SAM-dependent methyltransferase